MNFRKIKKGLEKILLTTLAVGMISCSSGGDNKKETNEEEINNPQIETIYSPDTKIISNEEANCIDSIDESSVNFSCFPDSLYSAFTGKILMFSGNERFPKGFLRRITCNSYNSFCTTSATLEEAIEQTEFSVNSSSSTSKFSSTKFAEGVIGVINSSGIPNRLYINKCFNDNFCVSGNLDLDFSFELEGKIKSFNFEYLHFNSEIKKSLELNAWTSTAVNFNESVNIAEYYGTPIITPAGIVFVPYFEIDLNASAVAEGSLDFGFRKSDSSTINLSYSNGSWSFDKSNEKNLDYTTIPELEKLNSNTKVSAKAQAGVLVYGVAGAVISGEAFAELNANFLSDPWWTLDAGVDLGFALKAGVFGYGIEYNKTIATLEKTLLEAEGGLSDGEGRGDDGNELFDQDFLKLAEGYSPAWSPDGKTIAYIKNDEIFFYDINSKTSNQITSGLNLDNYKNTFSVFWSPNGQKLGFTSNKNDGNSELYLIDLDGTNIQRKTWTSKNEYGGDWQGEEIVYWLDLTGGYKEVYSKNLLDNSAKRLFGQFAFSPKFGNNLVYLIAQGGDDCIYGIDPIRVGGNTSPVVYDINFNENVYDFSLNYDKDYLIYSTGINSTSKLNLLNISKRKEVEIFSTSDYSINLEATFSPDSNWIAFSSDMRCDYNYCYRDIYIKKIVNFFDQIK